ncbi:MAG: CRISPR system precrRNA processing endoribonuclease RAMP protein Cas6 [Nitrospirae bacterium]|nr:CRISPR system precrRNA processing endoribonuclease RAMP protein Cas6 [Nitrospirota bacterium]
MSRTDPKTFSIKVNTFQFTIVPNEPLILPAYKGSTFRGGFGYAFKRVVCAIRDKECPDCLLKEKCIYSYVFETPPPSDSTIMRKYKTAPHPFVIEPPPEKKRGFKPGDEITFGLTLIGRAIDYLPYFIYTFDELGKIGIGKGKTGYELKEVGCNGKKIYDSSTKTLKPFKTASLDIGNPTLENPQNNPPLGKGGEGGFISNLLTLNFITPTRILYNSHLILDLEFHILIRNLLRRLSLLYYFHCNGDPSEWDFKGMIEKAKEVKVKNKDLRWYDWERYSGRQATRLKMGGFVGSITFEAGIDPFIPLIKAGEVLHVGKGTGFGLGKYRIT